MRAISIRNQWGILAHALKNAEFTAVTAVCVK